MNSIPLSLDIQIIIPSVSPLVSSPFQSFLIPCKYRRLNAAAFINFRTNFGAAFIRGRRLFRWANNYLFLISRCRFATKRYTYGTSRSMATLATEASSRRAARLLALPITYAHAQIFSGADDEGDGDPFAELEEDDDELDENETVLEDCYTYHAVLYSYTLHCL